MKRLRDKTGYKVLRYYMGGEYGTLNWRPHYHAILFNHDWDDRTRFKETGSGSTIYTSRELERLWPYGYSSTADATFESAAYIARYCLQKVTGDAAEAHYKRFDQEGEYQLKPEYNRMSQGIGKDWLNFYKSDVFTHDYVISRGVITRVPAYYDKLFKRINPEEMERFKEEREWKAYQHRDDQTPERLKVKDTVLKAKINLLKRGEI